MGPAVAQGTSRQPPRRRAAAGRAATGALLLVLAALVVACDEAPTPTWVRLLDREPLSLERTFDPLDVEALLEGSSIVMLDRDLAAEDAAVTVLERETVAAAGAGLPPAEPGPRHVEGSAGRRLAVRPGEAFHSLVEVPPGPGLVVELEAEGSLGDLVAIPLAAVPGAERLADPAWLLSRVAGEGRGLRSVGPGRTRAVIPDARQTRALLVVGVAAEGPLVLGRLSVRRPSGLALDLLTGARAPDGERVILDDVAREALLLCPGDRVSWRAHVPDRSPRLSLALGRLGYPRGLTVRWEARAGDEVLDGEWTLGSGYTSWRELTPGLGQLAGREVELSLAVTSSEWSPEPAAGTALALGAPTLLGSPRPGSLGPDVIVVSLDTLRADRLEPGSPATPHLQRLAAEAARFDDATSTSSWTLPSHASLFSGRWPPTHGATNQSRRLSVPPAWLLAPAFREVGYETVAVTGGGFVSPTFGLAEGFEEYGFADPCQPVPVGEQGRLVRRPDSRERLVSLLEEPRRRPLFAFVHTYAAHSWAPLPEELEAMGLPADSGQSLRDQALSRDPRLAGQQPLDPEQEALLAERLQRLYDASASAADALVGELLEVLERTGRLENTVLVVLSDHGQEILERGLVGHGHGLHGELVRVPLLMRIPGVPAARIEAPVSLVDVAPTLRALVGLPADPGAEGLSLVPLLQGQPFPPRSRFAHVRALDSAVHRIDRQQRTLLASEDGGGDLAPTSLHDLSADPDERVDLLERHPAGGAGFLDELAEHLERTRGQRADDTDADVDDATRQRLLELGYTGDG